jgi:hypothetical protein
MSTRQSVAAVLAMMAVSAAGLVALAGYARVQPGDAVPCVDTNADLPTVLTAEELSKPKDAMPSPPGPGEGARNRGTPM